MTTSPAPYPSPLPPSAHVAIRAAGLTRHFAIPGRRGDAVVALREVDLALRAGTFTAIVGASGSGKSTLLHCLAGLDRPTRGVIELLGCDPAHMAAAELARFRASHVGFIFQEYNLISALTAAQNVALPAQLSGRPLSPDAITAALERVGIAPRAAQLPHQLSGGERQRVAAARVMASRPDLVFADEPTGALDPASADAVLGWLHELAESGTTVLMVTHDVAAAARADGVLVMHAGRLATQLTGGDPRAVSEALAECRSEDGAAA